MKSMAMDNTKVRSIGRLEAYLQMRETKGRFFSVSTIKKDGSERKFLARLGVKKGVKGEGMKYRPLAKRLMTVYDMSVKDFRTVNLETMYQMTISGQQYVIGG